METIDGFVESVRDRYPTRRVYRLVFDSVDTMNEALLWMLWVRRHEDDEVTIRKGVMARGFEHDGDGVLIVGGRLTREEVQQLTRIERQFRGSARTLRKRRDEAGGASRRAWRAAAIGVVCLLGLGAWALWRAEAGRTQIGDIHMAPQQYDGKTLRVRGTVIGVATLGGVAAYKIEDDTGQMIVVAGDVVPPAGSDVVIVGDVRASFSAGGETALVIIAKRTIVGT